MIVRIYTGHDGQTHFEDLPLPAEESHNVAPGGYQSRVPLFPCGLLERLAHRRPGDNTFFFSWGTRRTPLSSPRASQAPLQPAPHP